MSVPGSINKNSRGSDVDRLSADLSSVGQIELRLSKYGRIREEDKQVLLHIISPEFQDPTWVEDSLLFELYK
jgi:hypothetical protein